MWGRGLAGGGEETAGWEGRGTCLGEVDGAGAEGVDARGPGAVGGVAHQAVEEGPHRAEDLGWGAEGWLF